MYYVFKKSVGNVDMGRCLKYIVVPVLLFFTYSSINAQTLNPDTLKKYHVSEIRTYVLDSSGQKNLKETRVINAQGLIASIYLNRKMYIDSTRFSLIIDTIKFTYNTENKVSIRSSQTNETFYLNDNIEKTKDHFWISKTKYTNPLIINPFAKEIISFVHYKKNKEIIKRYAGGRRDAIFKYDSDGNSKYSNEKYYIRHYKNRRKDVKTYRFRSKRYMLLGRKKIIRTKSILNEDGHVIQKNIYQKTYYYGIFTKNSLAYSYVKTYQYTYQGALLSTCKTQQPNFVYTSRAKNDTKKNKYKRHKKYIRYVDERGVLTEEEFYEYSTY